MDGLRWLLLFFGLLVIAGVYVYSRREKAEPKPEPSTDRVEPTTDRVEPTLVADGIDGTPPDEEKPVDDGDVAPSNSDEVQQKIVTLRLVGRDGSSFRGDELILSLRGIGMRHGKFGIFHRIEGSEEDRTIFSAASLIEPGSFDLSNIKEQELPGVSLFLILPGPVEGAEAFDLMMETARTLAQTLDAELLDESGSTLSIQRERYMREEIIQFELSIKVA